VHAPLAGEVIKVSGDEIVLRHTPVEGATFFTRVARVQAAENCVAGASVAAGQLLAHTLAARSDSFLPTHAHIQLACAEIDSLPGMVPASERAVWESLCPDANLLLNHSGLRRAAHVAPEAVMHRRFQVFQRAQEFYFEHEPLHIVRGWKQYLYATDGHAYLDAINNVAHVGHSHPRVAEAAAKQLKRLYTNSRFLYDGLTEYAERLVATLPEPLRVVFFVCSGSEANDLALRLARTYTEQKDVIVIDGEYLGNTSAVYEISTSLLDNPLAGKQARPFVHMVPQPNLYRGKYRREDTHAAEKYAGEVREIVANVRAEGRGVAAFFTEALLGSSGGIDLPHGFLPKTYEYVRAAGGVCISDEVQVGFGRAGTHFWMFQTQGVVPDIVTMGKPMGNGFPVSAVVTTPAIAEAFRQKTTYFSTFAGNAAACQVGMAVLDIIEQEGLQENARVVGAYFKAGLQSLMEKHALIGAVYGFGLYMGVELVRDRETKQPATEEAAYVTERMRHLGIIVYPTSDYYNILKLKPPLVFTRANADYFVAMLDKVLGEDR
ncbi:MAG: aminotransferase class III-fold pyridoxal phosphate-dependent enzyme, partial [Anaerolineales bacterium]|nr:aminotransferase class III-fold pyridoxal phosphate-dependent enzyme [Anaerolineales bacterium]